MSSVCLLINLANLLLLNERADESLDEDKKEVAYLVKNFWKFLKMKNGKSFGKGKSSSFKNEKKDFKKKDTKDSSPSKGIVCYECNEYGHLKRECLNYLRGKSKVLTTVMSNLFNYVLALFSAKFACNSAFRNLVLGGNNVRVVCDRV